ncbi:unnamed protein product [Cuscuta campestris]|uniref:GUN4-like domain-containing protein n=1 Tax=Cuscuta campestris TaxID=132261 RepID=A0A484L816_9ASTE|nr:unnamed protein product [Cuscuta campestris]
MATTNSLPSIHSPPHGGGHRRTLRRSHSDFTSSPSSSFFLKKPPTPACTTVAVSLGVYKFSILSAAPTAVAPTAQSAAASFDLLERHLSARNFRQADEETRRLLIALAGDAAQERGYVFFSEVQFIPAPDLRRIDSLWREYSDGRFGYSVQKKIWDRVDGDFTELFMKIGWMKKLETEVVQYNYRSFPDEFSWELGDDVPEGHLPLTNALRGTRLLNYILIHPAFAWEEEGGGGGEDIGEEKGAGLQRISTVTKPDYSF